MDEQKFLADLTELLDTEDKISLDTNLEDIEEWDSLSYVMFQAQMLEKLQKKMDPNAVKAAHKVADLYELL